MTDFLNPPSMDALSLSEEWQARCNLDEEALLESDFIDRLAKLGEQSVNAAQGAADDTGFDSYWDLIGGLCKRVSLLDGESVRKAFQRFFLMRLSFDGDGEVFSFEGGVLSKEMRQLALNFSNSFEADKENLAPLVFVQSILGLFVQESLYLERSVALMNMVKRFTHLSNRPLILLEIGRMLYYSGAYKGFTEVHWREISEPGNLEGRHVPVCSALLFLALEAPSAWTEKLFFAWISPCVHFALKGGDFTRAERFLNQAGPCYLSPYSYAQEVKITGNYFSVLEDSAAQFKDGISALPLSKLRDDGPLSIAIVTMTPLDWGTPIRLALFLLHEIVLSQPGKHQFFLYSPFGVDMHNVADYFDKFGVTVRWLEDKDCPPLPDIDPLVSRFVYLRSEFAREDIDVAVYLRGSVLRESLFSQLRLAPVQIFWSMGYDWPPYQNMDGFLSCVPKSESTEMVNGQPWNWYRLLYHTLPDISEEKVAQLDEKFIKGRFVFGVLCQSFKLDCEDYIRTVAKILKGTSGSIFVWTGAYQPDNVTKYMKRYDIFDRCIFMGWVDPCSAHQIIDVFLDTFPMGNGSSLAEAMSLSIPVVSYAGADHYLADYFYEPAESGWFGEDDQKKFKEIIRDGGYILCKNHDEYIEEAIRLFEDESYRLKTGNVSYALAHELFFNKKAAVETFTFAIEDIVKRVRLREKPVP